MEIRSFYPVVISNIAEQIELYLFRNKESSQSSPLHNLKQMLVLDLFLFLHNLIIADVVHYPRPLREIALKRLKRQIGVPMSGVVGGQRYLAPPTRLIT